MKRINDSLEREKDPKKLQELLEKWGFYKAYLSEYYRKQIVSEPLGWLNFNKKKGK